VKMHHIALAVRRAILWSSSTSPEDSKIKRKEERTSESHSPPCNSALRPTPAPSRTVCTSPGSSTGCTAGTADHGRTSLQPVGQASTWARGRRAVPPGPSGRVLTQEGPTAPASAGSAVSFVASTCVRTTYGARPCIRPAGLGYIVHPQQAERRRVLDRAEPEADGFGMIATPDSRLRRGRCG